jgi:hypothetical protein
MVEKRTIVCNKCGKVYRKEFYEGDRYQIECDCGNTIKGNL